MLNFAHHKTFEEVRMSADVTTEFGLALRTVAGRGGAEISGVNCLPICRPPP